jgi:predicted Fe-Mo cluster-binding NifX family protein
MKALIAVSENRGEESAIDSRFGRAAYFMIYDVENNNIIDIDENRFRNEEHGVGIKTAGFAVGKGCSLIIGAQPGPKAEEILNHGNIEIFVITSGSVREAVAAYRKARS